MSFFSRLKDGLAKTRRQISSIVGGKAEFGDELYDTLEDALISADAGIELTDATIARLKKEVVEKNVMQTADVYELLKSILVENLTILPVAPVNTENRPWVILVVGVNGVGKTTTIGKLSNEYRLNGKTVLMGAADTFRAGAIEQLRIWSERTNADFVAQSEGADPASVAYDAIEAAKARNIDVLIMDTAGRLHNKVNLMNELEKIVRVMRRNTPHAPDEVLLVIDATTGQNALKQAQVFNDVVGITGFVITKLDGTAKGGIAMALTSKFGLPIRKIGVGETMEDLQDFDATAYVEAMFGNLNEEEQ